MSQVFAFHGGVHPPENKRQSTRTPIRQAPVPGRLVLPLSQHIGAPAEPCIQVGDKVLKGQRIATPVGRISAALHAPTSGTVSAIAPHPIPHASGMEANCIIIDSDGEDRWGEHAGLADYRALGKAALTDYIRNSGITGMGGAGFPTDVKLHLGDDHIVNTLIINAAECEPYITADDMLMRERADDIVAGIEIIDHLLKPSHILIGIEDNKPQAVRALEKALAGCRLNIDLRVVPTKYPSGGEKQLIKLLTDVEVPSGRIPADVGIVCQNVGTAYATARAVHHGEPLISRIVTLTGEAVAQPQNFEALIGTPYELLLRAARVSPNDLYRLVVGGPMMGFSVDNDQIPVIKTTNCLIAASPDEMPEAPPAQECIRCGLCEQVCPAELLPQQLYWFAKGRELDKAKHHNLFDCIECGACSYVCSSAIPLVQYYRNAKAEIRSDDAEQRKAEHARVRFEARQARLEAEQAEKEARRKARAEEAARNQAARKDKPLAATPSTSAASAAAPAAEPDLKQLKTAASVARTKLKQAQKALKNAEDKGLEGIDTLRDTLTALNARADATQQAYDQALNADSAASAAPDAKQLKTNAAVARTKLKQAEKALATARDNGSDEIAALESRVRELELRAHDAQQAYDAADAGAAPSIDPAKLAELKADMEAARAKVDKAQAALEGAIASGSPAVEKMTAGVEKLRAKYLEAKAAHDTASAPAVAPAGAPTISPTRIAELKADMEAARAKVDKAQAALEGAIASGSPAVEKMTAGVEKLRAKYLEAKAAHDTASAPAVAPAGAPTISPARIAELKADMEAARAKVDKAQTALEGAIASGSPAVEKMTAGVEKLRAKYLEAKAALDTAAGSHAESVAAAPAAQAPVDIKALKQQVSIMRTKLKKAEKTLQDADADNQASLNAEVQELSARFESAQAELKTAEQARIDVAAAAGVDLKQLQIDAAMARAEVTKTERALGIADSTAATELEQALLQARSRADELSKTLSRFE
ncbi:electron transport complex subunit RsxC [Marinobacterium rhizophilum]|uniref:Ion-translocating oxidoreductase complex subunit C n=1 Tax=Marinobacterium rhizophilum TaxID=420402 RepID=A0ABY5HQR9_9GAMM|nr:electron transport complex subunit RsxC [Marinobacterium rhizophilum]UTW13908.1 electron transport complex subunit RsxC [Marinobacterium rhizophilum]